MERRIRVHLVVEGSAEGQLVASREPLSFWGGYDQRTGEVIDRRHPLSGQVVAGRVLAVPFSKGSSTTTAVLLEAVRAGVAPAAILTDRIDGVLALASIVADEMYGRPIPIAVLDAADFASLCSGSRVRLEASGVLHVRDGG